MKTVTVHFYMNGHGSQTRNYESAHVIMQDRTYIIQDSAGNTLAYYPVMFTFIEISTKK